MRTSIMFLSFIFCLLNIITTDADKDESKNVENKDESKDIKEDLNKKDDPATIKTYKLVLEDFYSLLGDNVIFVDMVQKKIVEDLKEGDDIGVYVSLTPGLSLPFIIGYNLEFGYISPLEITFDKSQQYIHKHLNEEKYYQVEKNTEEEAKHETTASKSDTKTEPSLNAKKEITPKRHKRILTI